MRNAIKNFDICPLCKNMLSLLKVREAAKFLQVSNKTIYGYIESGVIYSVTTVGGTYRVCRGCLIKPYLSEMEKE